MQILIDADAFPKILRDIVFRAAKRCHIRVIMIANKRLRVPESELFSSLMVADGPDAADDRIVEMVQAEDIVITADIPLAARVIDRGGVAIDPRGQLYTDANVKERLATRDLLSQLRDDGEISGGPPAFSTKNREQFTNQLDRLLTAAKSN